MVYYNIVHHFLFKPYEKNIFTNSNPSCNLIKQLRTYW